MFSLLIEVGNFLLLHFSSHLILRISDAGECHGFPGPGVDHIYTFNPMREFAHGHTKHVDDSFDAFQKTHQKQYQNETEEDHRKNIFRQNMRYFVYLI
jgi:hypothetical protein